MPTENNYDTKLSPSEEATFTSWVSKQYPGKKVSDVTSDYDLRGAWREINKGNIKFDKRGHLPDTYKKPNHITFSDQSVYHSKDNPGGKWIEYKPEAKDLKGNASKWNFQPSSHNIKTHGKDNILKYFSKNEPDSKVIFTPEGFSSVKDISSTSNVNKLKINKK